MKLYNPSDWPPKTTYITGQGIQYAALTTMSNAIYTPSVTAWPSPTSITPITGSGFVTVGGQNFTFESSDYTMTPFAPEMDAKEAVRIVEEWIEDLPTVWEEHGRTTGAWKTDVGVCALGAGMFHSRTEEDSQHFTRATQQVLGDVGRNIIIRANDGRFGAVGGTFVTNPPQTVEEIQALARDMVAKFKEKFQDEL